MINTIINSNTFTFTGNCNFRILHALFNDNIVTVTFTEKLSYGNQLQN